MTKFYRIKAFSKLTSVTVRTLHYYDEIGLLKPTGKTKYRHRLYAETDLLRLQQISTLKFMKFSLNDIKNILLDKNFDIKNSLKIQAEILSSESERMKQAEQLVSYLVNSLETENQVDWKIVTKIIEVMQMSESNRKEWEAKYLNAEEFQSFEKLVSTRSVEEWKKYHQRWLLLLDEVKQNINSDPGSNIGQELARKWMDLVDEIYGDYPQLRKKMWEALKAEIMPKEDFPYTRAVIAYIGKAVDKLFGHNGGQA